MPLSPTQWTPLGPAPILKGDVPGKMDISGRITALAADPANANVIYVAAAGGGVWLTTDGGVKWKPLMDQQAGVNPAAQQTDFMGALAVVFDATDRGKDTIYTGTGEQNGTTDCFYGRGVLKSTDGGKTWTQLKDSAGTNPFDRRTISAICVDPRDRDVVYVAVGNQGANGKDDNTGVWKLVKGAGGATTWTNTTDGTVPTTGGFVSDLILDRAHPDTLYAAVGNLFGLAANGVYRTTDGGAHWYAAGDLPQGVTRGDPPAQVNGRITLALAPTNSSVVYAAVADALTDGLYRIYKTTNADDIDPAPPAAGNPADRVHWVALAGAPAALPDYMGKQGYYDTALAADPTNANILYAGGQDFGKASDGNYISALLRIDATNAAAVTFTRIGTTGAGPTLRGPSVDNHALAFDRNNHLLVGTDGGIWRRDVDAGGAPIWNDLNGNLQITQFYGIALDPRNLDIAYGGSQDNGVEKFNNSLQWTHDLPGDGGVVQVDPVNPDQVYAEQKKLTFYRSDSAGAPGSFNDLSAGLLGTPSFIDPYIIAPASAANPPTWRLLYGTTRLNVSIDKGKTWTQLGAKTFPGPIESIAAVQPGTTQAQSLDWQTIYVGVKGGRLFVTHDNGANWTNLTGPAHNLPAASSSLSYRGIVVDPDHPNTAFLVAASFGDVTGGAHVWKTIDGGTNWTDISGNLPDLPTWTIQFAPGTGGTDAGVLYVGTDSGVYYCNNFTAAAGITWTRLEDIPPVQVRQLVLQLPTQFSRTGSQAVLAAGTHGRGLWELLLPPAGDVVAVPTKLQATEGNALTNVVVAKFNNGQRNIAIGGYSATIDWGDGTPPTNGVIASDGKGGYTVTGTHTYAEEGLYVAAVRVLPPGGGAGALVKTNVQVLDAPLAIVNDGALAAVEGAAFSDVVATFTDANPGASLTDFTATIDWGDGNVTAGGIVANADGSFSVLGTNTYADEGAYAVGVTILDQGGSTAQAVTLLDVADAPLAATGRTFTVIGGGILSGVPFPGFFFNGVVATFTDANPSAPATDFTATIDWGDGSSSAGTITANPGGGFSVSGEHLYAGPVPGPVTVQIVDDGGSSATAYSTPVFYTPPEAAPLTYVYHPTGTLLAVQWGGFLNGVGDLGPGIPNQPTFGADAAHGVLAEGAVDPNGLLLSTILLADGAHGHVQLNADGSFDYTPGPGFAGTDAFEYAPTDGVLRGNPVEVTITLPPAVVFAGVPNLLTLATPQNTPWTVPPLGNGLSIVVLSQPLHGSLVVNGDGSTTYTPSAGFVGTDAATIELVGPNFVDPIEVLLTAGGLIPS
jgi:hypothetical protein